jgi:hypothetical protein
MVASGYGSAGVPRRQVRVRTRVTPFHGKLFRKIRFYIPSNSEVMRLQWAEAFVLYSLNSDRSKDLEDEKSASALFEYFHAHRHDIRPLVRHEIRIGYDMDHVFEISFRNIRERLVPAPEDQDVEPLDKEADACNDPINPEDNADKDPVDDTNEQLEAVCVVFVDKELLRCRCCFRYTNHRSYGIPIIVIKCMYG